MRLSDVRKGKTKSIYLNHSTPPYLNEVETRCTNRLLEFTRDRASILGVGDGGQRR
jgi:hypothetical protein